MNNPLDRTLRELDACGCCVGTAPQTPVAISNRPGLSAITFRAGTQPQFKATLLAALSDASSQSLAQLKTREDDDFTIALLDGWATVADVLSFYSERIANESYLRTATERRSVLELARAIGYELKPGVAAATWLAFTIEDAPGTPGYSNIPQGTKAQSLPGPDEKPQVYETTEAILGRQEWNELHPVRTVLPAPHWGQHTLRLKGTTTNLKPGDALLIVGDERIEDSGNENWDFRRVNKIDMFASAEPPYTLVTLERGLGAAIPHVDPAKKNAKVFALRQRLNLFGYNAPDLRTPQFTLGLEGEYFKGSDFGQHAFTRVDPNVDFTWNEVSPAPGLGKENYSVRWTGVVKTSAAGNYVFTTSSDDGVRLWVNGQLLIDKWVPQAKMSWTGQIVLAADSFYDLRLEYFQGPDNAEVHLSWTEPGQAPQIIPPERLFRTELPAEWPGLTLADISGTPPAAEITTLHIDGTHPEVIPGTWLVVSTPDYDELYEVTSAIGDSRSGFTLNAKTTHVGVKGEKLREQFNNKVRSITVFAQSEELVRAPEPAVDPVLGDSITLENLIPDLPVPRTLLVRGAAAHVKVLPKGAPLRLTLESGATIPLSVDQRLTLLRQPTPTPTLHTAGRWDLRTDKDQSGWVEATLDQLHYDSAPDGALLLMEVATLRLVETPGDGRTRLTLAQPLAHAYDPFTTTILANVAHATHGETVKEVLGNGDASQQNQQFTLKQKPLTYVPASTPAGTASTLEMWINDVRWQEMPTLYGRDPRERIFITRRADDGTVTVEFGDGQRGTRLPSGQENVRAVYRKGIGSEGRVKAGQLSLLMTRPLGVKSVTNPLAPSEPADPQLLDDARRNAPRTVLTLDRVVSLQDYEDFTRDFPGIAKAHATWTWSEQTRGVLLSVLGPNGRVLPEDSETVRSLIAALQKVGNPLVPVLVKSAPPVRFTLSARVAVVADRDPDQVLAAVRATLRANFAFDAREFGQGLALSEIIALMQNVPGVDSVDVDEPKRHDVSAPYLIAAKPAKGIAASQAKAAELLILDEASLANVELTKP